MTKIQQARIKANITQAEVGEIVGRTPAWVSMAERQKLDLMPETEARILSAIHGLAALRGAIGRYKENLIQKLQLPQGGQSEAI